MTLTIKKREQRAASTMAKLNQMNEVMREGVFMSKLVDKDFDIQAVVSELNISQDVFEELMESELVSKFIEKHADFRTKNMLSSLEHKEKARQIKDELYSIALSKAIEHKTNGSLSLKEALSSLKELGGLEQQDRKTERSSMTVRVNNVYGAPASSQQYTRHDIEQQTRSANVVISGLEDDV